MTNRTRTTTVVIPNTFTQRGVLGVDPRSGLTRVSLLESGWGAGQPYAFLCRA